MVYAKVSAMINENLLCIRSRIADAAGRVKRDPAEITLVCITKNATQGQIEEAISHEVLHIGENRLQDALLKHNQLGELAEEITWHMVGHLQTNKVKKALDIFNIIHSVDSLRVAEEINRRAASLKRRIDCFVEVNVSQERLKYGVATEKAELLVKNISTLAHIHIIGLMTMAPWTEDAELARPYFVKLRNLKDKLQTQNIPNTDIKELSMGMSQDFEVAIEEGATYVRIGTAIFGE